MNRILPLVLLAAAVGLHFTYCEWEIRGRKEHVSQAESARTIYWRYSPSQSVALLARSSDRQDATIWGVLAPGLLVGGAFLIAHFQKDGREAEAW